MNVFVYIFVRDDVLRWASYARFYCHFFCCVMKFHFHLFDFDCDNLFDCGYGFDWWWRWSSVKVTCFLVGGFFYSSSPDFENSKIHTYKWVYLIKTALWTIRCANHQQRYLIAVWCVVVLDIHHTTIVTRNHEIPCWTNSLNLTHRSWNFCLTFYLVDIFKVFL